MARINVEERYWTDPRRKHLLRLLKDEDLMDGCMMAAWKVAQTYWSVGKKPVPLNVFDHLRFSKEIMESGLARESTEILNPGMYVLGSRECFEWLADRKEAASRGGRKSGQTRRSKAEAKRSKREVNASKRKQSEPSYSSSSSFSKEKEKSPNSSNSTDSTFCEVRAIEGEGGFVDKSKIDVDNLREAFSLQRELDAHRNRVGEAS